MRVLSAAAQNALNNNRAVIRDFLWITVKDRTTGDPFTKGYWSGVVSTNVEVIDPQTGNTETRPFEAAGQLIEIDGVPMAANLSVKTINIKLSSVGNVNDLVRQYDAKLAPIEVFRGLFELDGGAQLAPAFPRFFGEVDDPSFDTPAANEAGALTIKCVSKARELRVTNPATRSDAYQRLRDPTDSFRQHAATVGTWVLNWGGN